MQPINYLTQVADPFAQAAQGYKLGATIVDVEAKRAEAARQQQAMQQQQQQLAQEQARFFTNPNPTMRDAARFASMLSPEQSKAFLPYMEGITKAQQQGTLRRTGQLLSSLQLNPSIAVERLKQEAEAARNSGDAEEAALFDRLATAAADPAQGPSVAFKALVQSASAIPGAKEMFETIDKGMGTAREEAMFPSKLGEAQSNAQKAAVAAKFAESNAALDLEKKGWDITKIQEDIKIAKQNAGIAALNAQISREGNDLKRRELQLKVQEMEQKRDEAVRGKVAEASTAAAQADNLLNTVEKALNMSVTGRDKSGKPTGFTGTITSATGPISSRMPTLSQDVADFEETINTLGSQITMSRIGEMKGALSDKDLATLQSSLQSLSLRQSPQQLVNNLLEVQRLTQKARKNTMDKFGAPATLSVPDTPAAQPSPAEIDDLVKKYGGGR